MTAKASITRRALRPRDIKERFGIAPGTLHYYCETVPANDRLPSIKLPGKAGTRSKGKRLVFEDDLLAWLNKYRTEGAV